MSEEELQNFIESEKKGDGSLDHIAYERVFRALSHEPSNTLPVNFADKVVQMVELRRAEKISSKEVIIIASVFILSLAVFIASLLLTKFKLEWGFLRSMNEYKGLFIFGFVFILLLQWVDKTILRRNQTI